MAYFETEKDGIKYVAVDGKMCNLKYRASVGKHGKPFATFSVAYDYEYDEFGQVKNKYINCCAWADIAEIAYCLSEQGKLRISAKGRLRISEYNGEQKEQLECTWIETLFEIPNIVKPKSETKDDDDFGGLNY